MIWGKFERRKLNCSCVIMKNVTNLPVFGNFGGRGGGWGDETYPINVNVKCIFTL